MQCSSTEVLSRFNCDFCPSAFVVCAFTLTNSACLYNLTYIFTIEGKSLSALPVVRKGVLCVMSTYDLNDIHVTIYLRRYGHQSIDH